MKFVVLDYPPSYAQPGIGYLVADGWDDYSFKTSFNLFLAGNGIEPKSIGLVKIISRGMAEGRVSLPAEFSQLGNNFCSLGQEQAYYEELMALPNHYRREILLALRDCISSPKIYEDFATEQALLVSLTRSVSQDRMLSFKSILQGNITLTPYYFRFRLRADKKKSVKVRVAPYSTPPTNVHVLIGRNGVGKTRILSGIADELMNAETGDFSLKGSIEFPNNTDTDEELFQSAVTEEHGQFANLITVAFSAFDKFSPLQTSLVGPNIRYDYLGLKNGGETHEFKNPGDLENEFSRSLGICLDTQRKTRWIEAVRILNSDPLFAEYGLEHIADKSSWEEITNIFSNLSSGHKIVLLSVTRLVELVEERTLVLLDEPENHLHPPLLSSFTRVLSDLLIKRNGVALIATHSPVVVQEVPKSCVTIINRVNSEYEFFRPDIETFGENVGTLTREIFKLEATESGYHKIISEYLKRMSYEELIEEFRGQIGGEGRAIARAISAYKEE